MTTLITVDGRTYRKANIIRKGRAIVDTYSADTSESMMCDDEPATCAATTELSSGKKQIAFELDPALYRFIIGPGGKTKREIEKDTETQIKIPGKESKSKTVTVTGRDDQAVTQAKFRIDLLIESNLKKLDPNYFLSIPLLSPEIADRLAVFKEEALRSGANGLEDSIFIKPKTFHLTICMLKLYTADTLEQVNPFTFPTNTQLSFAFFFIMYSTSINYTSSRVYCIKFFQRAK
eukprot:Colp12_sorted_trinity150504_noHs@25809